MTPADAESRRNYRLGVWNGVLFTIGDGFIDPSTVIPVLLSSLTSSSALIGFAAALSDLGWLLPQIFVAPWAVRLPRQLGLYRRAAVVRALGLFAVAALAWPLRDRPVAMLAAFLLGYGAYGFGAGFGAVAFFEIIGRTVPTERLTPLWSARLFWGGLLAALGALMVREVLRLEPAALRFAILFGAALVFAATGWTLFSRIREPEHPPGHAGTARELLEGGFRMLYRDTPFRRLLAARVVLNVWLAASPFIVLFAVRDLNGQARAAGTFLFARIAGFVLSNLAWRPLARTYGNRALMVTGTLGAGVIALAAAGIVVASPWRLGLITERTAVLLLEAVAFFGGAVHSGLSVGFSSLAIELAPPGGRQAFVSLLNTFVGPTMLLPMLGGFLLDRTSAPVLFAACGIVALAGARAAWRLPEACSILPS